MEPDFDGNDTTLDVVAGGGLGAAGRTPVARSRSSSRSRPRQPPPPDAVVTVSMMEKMLETALAKHLGGTRNRGDDTRAPAAPRLPAPQDEVSRMIALSDAMRGQDNPSWRLCPGLVLNRFVQDKFLIFSIPHLLHREVGGEMVRVQLGTAVRSYTAMLSNCKMQFPNQIQVRMQAAGKDAKTASFHEENAAGTRAQIERAERMFLDILGRIDQSPARDFPASKREWMLAIDIGVELLELYATLAFTFPKGGAKIAVAHSAAIAQGKFDPAKLWESVATQSFRN